MTPDEKAKWKTRADSLDTRNKSRVLAAFQRMAQAEISPGEAGGGVDFVSSGS